MITATALFKPEQFEQLANAYTVGTINAVRMLWDALIKVLAQNWQSVMISLFIFFVIALLKAMLGRWGTLCSLIYNLFYLGILLIIGLIWGPEVFVNDYFNMACAVILYPICYWVTGFILDKFKFRSH
jgi:hypothetical protein